MVDHAIAGYRNKAVLRTATVFVVDDDPDVRRSISILARSVDLHVETFPSAQDFLQTYSDERAGCLVLDVRMPGMSGLELQQQLAENQSRIPIIVLTAYAEVSMATQAMRGGALDFIQKPYSPQALLERIYEAIQVDADERLKRNEQSRAVQLAASLSPRERQVMKLLATGYSTKQIAAQLEISIKTVDNHRSKILEKMQVDNLVQLARIATFTQD